MTRSQRPGRGGVSRPTARRGTAAIELALLLPLLALLFSAVLDVARAFYALQTLESAAGSAAAYASGTAMVPTQSVDTQTYARQVAYADAASLSPALQPSGVTITAGGGSVTVVVDYDFPLLTAVIYPDATVHLQRSVTLATAPRPGN